MCFQSNFTQVSSNIPELGDAQVSAEPDYRPVVIMTSNSEKTLPDAFPRRRRLVDLVDEHNRPAAPAMLEIGGHYPCGYLRGIGKHDGKSQVH